MYTEKERNKLFDSLTSHNVIVQDLLDIQNEYRVIVFNTGHVDAENICCVVEKRVGYGIADPRERKHWEISPFDMELGDTILPVLAKMVSRSRSPYIAFDVYIEKHGGWGCFETSRNPGLEYSPATLKKMINWTTDSINLLINTNVK